MLSMKDKQMRTSIVSDDQLMAQAMEANGVQSKRGVVELGLKTLLRLSRQQHLRGLREKIDWQVHLNAMRRDDPPT